MAGLNAPVTLAGSLALGAAESLFAILLEQLRATGSPCFLTAAMGGTNMRNGIFYITCPEGS
jgi:Trimethylamine:corrinoid methyltransferase